MQGVHLLDEAYDGVNQHHAEDHTGVDPAFKKACYEASRQKNVDERMVELGQEQHDGVLALFWRQAVRADAIASARRFVLTQAACAIYLQVLG